MPENEFQPPDPACRIRRDVLLIGAVGVWVCFFHLGQNAVWKHFEPRHAAIAAAMAESGDYLIPRRLGELYPDKPPTMHAASAWLFRLFGQYSMFLARTPSALAGILGAIALYGSARILHQRQTALFAALALLATFGWAERARIARVDAVFAATILLACWGWLAAMQERNRSRRAMLFGCGALASGLATLTKGPYGILFPLLVVALAPLQAKQLQRPRWTEWLVMGCAFVMIPLAWAVPVYLRDEGDFLRMVLGHGELLMEPKTALPVYWYFQKSMPMYFLPWTLFLPLAAVDIKRHHAATWIAIVIFAILSVVPNKDDHYLLPWYPFAVLAVAASVMERRNPAWLQRAAWWALTISVVVLPTSFGLIRPWMRNGEDPERTFARRIFEAVPEGGVLLGNWRMLEATQWHAYEQGQPHRFHVRGSPSAISAVGKELEQQVRETLAKGRPCFLVIRDKEQKKSLAFLQDVSVEEIFFTEWDQQRYTLYRVRPPP